MLRGTARIGQKALFLNIKSSKETFSQTFQVYRL
jgi:hypothetical protein